VEIIAIQLNGWSVVRMNLNRK